MLPDKKYEDYAVITKVDNPDNPQNKVIWVSGIRGIGTWGAAEFLKKWWYQLYKELPSRKKSTNFSVLLKVKYSNCDIANVSVRRFKIL